MTDQNQSSDQPHTHITCSHCDYDLTGLDLQGLCPECGQSIISTCFKCDYDLTGLDHSGVCPECGFSIEGSIGRGELAKADPQYLASLHKGVFIIQATIIAMILLMFIGIGISFVVGLNNTASSTALDIGSSLVWLIIAALMIYGWWLFSAEDPNYTGDYTGSDARKLVRVMIVIGAVFTLVNLVLELPPANAAPGAVFIGLAIIGLGITVVRFFAEMFYIKWMAPLLRNKKVYNRAKLLMWLGPVLMTVGLLLLGLGPLIALVLYWNMLDWIRKDLKAIRQHNNAIA